MHEKAVPARSEKYPNENKARIAPIMKKVVVYPPANPSGPSGRREISQDPYYPTDRYKLCSPLFPDAGSIRVSEPS